MLSESERKKIIEDLRRAREEVNQVKVLLKKANSEKENWFKKKSAISNEIKGKIGAVQTLKKERNKFKDALFYSKCKKH